MNRFLIAFIIILVFQGFNNSVKSCTTFIIDEKADLVFGRNFDFDVGFGHIIVNKRNIKKNAMIQPPEKPFEWTSKYGSVTFNQGGREFPYGGINEKGLVIEQMWLDETKYSQIDKRYGLSELQWIQYQLDNSSSVSDVLKSDSMIRISSQSVASLHFLVCDKEGNKATIEYLNGKMVVHSGSLLPISVLANHSFKKSYDYLETKADFGGTDSSSYTSQSLDRFANAARMIQKHEKENIIDYSFDILKSVSQGKWTHWSIVYDIKNMIIYYKTKNNLNRRAINITDLDFSCSFPVLFVDIESDMDDEEIMFKEYSYKENRALIDSVCNNVKFLKSMPEEAKEYSARYPETTNCCE
jgi:choloylglycine hydrolase